MEVIHNIKLSSGKNIELTDKEVEEILSFFKKGHKSDYRFTPLYVEYPEYRRYPVWESGPGTSSPLTSSPLTVNCVETVLQNKQGLT